MHAVIIRKKLTGQSIGQRMLRPGRRERKDKRAEIINDTKRAPRRQTKKGKRGRGEPPKMSRAKKHLYNNTITRIKK